MPKPLALTTKQIQIKVKSLDGWSIENKKMPELTKLFKFSDFSKSIEFVNKVAKI